MLTLKPTVTTESNVQTSADPPNYDYCRVDGESRAHKQPQETMYATVANGEKHNYHSIENEGVGQYDYTAIYDDPTSPSYVVGVQAMVIDYYYYETLFHCSLRYTPVEVYLMLLGHMYLPW